jgi:hypothetical protein
VGRNVLKFEIIELPLGFPFGVFSFDDYNSCDHHHCSYQSDHYPNYDFYKKNKNKKKTQERKRIMRRNKEPRLNTGTPE